MCVSLKSIEKIQEKLVIFRGLNSYKELLYNQLKIF